MWVMDIETRKILDVNQAAIDRYGYSREEFLQLTADQLRPKEDLERFLKHLQTHARTPTVASGLWRHITKNGTLLWANVRSSLLNYNGRMARLVASLDLTQMVGDWTEKRTVDPALFKVLQRLKIVAESIQDGFLFLNSNLEVMQVNPMVCRRAGVEEQQLIGKHLRELPEWMETSEIMTRIQAISDTGTSSSFECVDKRSGEWLRFIIYPNEDGYAIFLRDVTLEKAAQHRLELEHQRLEALINNTESLIFTVDLSDRLTLFNSRFADVVIASRRIPPMVGEQLQELPFSESFLEPWRKHVGLVHAGEQHAIEVYAPVIGTRQRYYIMRLNPIREGRLVVGISVVMQDIHELRTSLERVRKSNEVLQEVARISAHELRGPLTSIMSLLQMVEPEQSTNPHNAEILVELSSISTNVDDILHRLVAKTQSIDE